MKEYIKNLKAQLLYEFRHKKNGGIYSFLQKSMAYNSNRIEGSTLTERQTASIYDTGTIFAEEDVLYRTKDIEETTGHFRMFNNVLKTLEEPLSIKLIKSMHYDLKVGVFEDQANGYPCGEFKNRANIVSDIKTVKPADMPDAMEELIRNYHRINDICIKGLAKFHAEYEAIHPFQDGNGRTGRMILFRESLKHDMIPVIIHDDEKARYYQYLNVAQKKQEYDPLTVFF